LEGPSSSDYWSLDETGSTGKLIVIHTATAVGAAEAGAFGETRHVSIGGI